MLDLHDGIERGVGQPGEGVIGTAAVEAHQVAAQIAGDIAPPESVVAQSAGEDVIALATVQHVISRAAGDLVGQFIAGARDICRGIHQGAGGIPGLEHQLLDIGDAGQAESGQGAEDGVITSGIRPVRVCFNDLVTRQGDGIALGIDAAARQAIDHVGVAAAATGQGVDSCTAVQGIVAATAGDAIGEGVAGASERELLHLACPGRLAIRSEDGYRGTQIVEILQIGAQRIGSEAGLNLVQPRIQRFADHISGNGLGWIGIGGGVDDVDIITLATAELIAAGATIQSIVAQATRQTVIAAATQDRVIAGQAVKRIDLCRAFIVVGKRARGVLQQVVSRQGRVAQAVGEANPFDTDQGIGLDDPLRRAADLDDGVGDAAVGDPTEDIVGPHALKND